MERRKSDWNDATSDVAVVQHKTKWSYINACDHGMSTLRIGNVHTVDERCLCAAHMYTKKYAYDVGST